MTLTINTSERTRSWYIHEDFHVRHISSSQISITFIVICVMLSSIQYLFILIFSIANISIRGQEVLIVLLVGESSFVKVTSNLFYIRFGLAKGSIMIEEEILEKYGVIKDGILQTRCRGDKSYCWFLHFGQYKAYGLIMKQLVASTEILVPSSNTSTIEFLLVHCNSV